ncbi:MAG: hypothetical protein HQL73_06200 [Magnetococcales bacterium]|nr:hypothetical protein [Magnetococcales bacterium]
MASVIFYEKPGCINNRLQRALLRASGHVLEVRDLLSIRWTASRLCWFFADLPVACWFNRSAPRIKSGEIIPELVSAEQALHYMIADPLLIRRPLMEVDGQPVVGFDMVELDRRIGLVKGRPVQGIGNTDLVPAPNDPNFMETCSRTRQCQPVDHFPPALNSNEALEV